MKTISWSLKDGNVGKKNDHENDCNDANQDENDNDMGLSRNGAFPHVWDLMTGNQ